MVTKHYPTSACTIKRNLEENENKFNFLLRIRSNFFFIYLVRFSNQTTITPLFGLVRKSNISCHNINVLIKNYCSKNRCCTLSTRYFNRCGSSRTMQQPFTTLTRGIFWKTLSTTIWTVTIPSKYNITY